MPITITEAELKRFAPKAKAEYVAALMGNLDVLEAAGILDNKFRLAHFLGQCGEETGGLVKLRESFTYTVNRLRVVFPKYVKGKIDAQLRDLIADPVKLADLVYGTRLGNRKGTSDAYDYRGGGWLQVTGRANVTAYCAELGIDPIPAVLDDHVITLKMAAIAWSKGNCNHWADLNDILKVSKIINTGSATSGVMPNGMEERKHWLGQALKVWESPQAKALAAVADVQAHEVESRTITAGTVLKRTGELATGAGIIKGVSDAVLPASVPKPPSVDLTEIANQLTATQKIMDAAGAVSKVAIAHWWVAVIVLGVVVWLYGAKIKAWYLEDIRTGKRTPALKGKS